MEIFNTVEFYVIAVMVAAAIVAAFCRPHSSGPARQHLLSTTLSMDHAYTGPEAIMLTIDDDYNVTLTRRGIRDLTEAGALSLAIEIKGFDITVKERVVYDRRPSWPVNTATATLDFLGPERYHLHYINPESERMAATPLPVKPGIKIEKDLL